MSLSLKVILNNEHFIAVNKPPGLVTQGADANGNLLALVKQQFKYDVLPVHRLDAATSGVVVLAKTQVAASNLASQFAEHKVSKIYLALSDKKPKKKQGKVVGDMVRSRSGTWMLTRTVNNPAKTQFYSFGMADEPRLFVLKPITGKTHQLRVAMKSLGAAIVGDDKYGGSLSDRLYLHAFQMQFKLFDSEFSLESNEWLGTLFTNESFQQRINALGAVDGLLLP